MQLLIIVIAALSCLPLAAQPVIIAGPVYNPHDISHSMARVGMVTNVTGRRAVEFGLTATPDATWQRRYPDWSSLYDKHEWYMDALQGGTLYRWRMCAGLDTYTSGITVQVNPTNTVTRSAHGFVDGDLIMMSAGITAGKPDGTLYNLGNNITYFVRDATANTFKLATSAGGGVVAITGTLSGSIRMGKAVCSAVQTLTTPADPAVHPAPPAQVTVALPAASPEITGATYAGDANCQFSGVGLQEFLLATIAPLTGSTNVAITLPDGADCRGSFIFPARAAHSGWVVMKPAAAAAHPPAGVRTTPPFRAQKPKLTNNLAPVMQRNGTTSEYIAACAGVGEIHMSNTTNQFSVDAPGITNLWNCVSTTSAEVTKTITAISAGTLATTQFTVPAHGWAANVGYMTMPLGTGVSGLDNVAFPLLVVDANTLKLHTTATNAVAACSSGACGSIKIRTNKVPLADSFGDIANRPAEPCTNGAMYSLMDITVPLGTPTLNTIDVCRDNAWVRMRYAFGGVGAANIPGVTVNGNKYRFDNMEIRYERWPEDVATMYGDWGTGNQKQGRMNSLIDTDAAASDVVFDRCDIHSYDYPHRTSSPLNLGGSRVSIINSRLADLSSWLKFPHPPLLETNGIQLMQAEDFVFRNNYLQCAGICVYVHPHPGNNIEYTQILRPQRNLLIQRNLFQKKPSQLSGTNENASVSPNRVYSNRHHFEFKSGQLAKFDGNILDYNWGDTSQGATLLQTPTGGTGTWISSPLTSITSGGVITYTTVLYFDQIPDPAVVPVMVAVYNTDNPALHGIYSITSRSPAANTITVSGMPAGTATSGTVTVMFGTSGVNDVTVSNNTIMHGPVGTYSNAYNTAQSGFIVQKSRRIMWTNNWFHDLNRRGCQFPAQTGVCKITDGPPYGYYSGTGSQSNGRDGYVWSSQSAGEDFWFTNNTATDINGLGMSMMDFQGWSYQSGEGMTIKNNVFSTVAVVGEGPVDGITTDAPAGTFGVDALTRAFPNRAGSSNPGWRSGNNVLPGASTNAAKYPGIGTLASIAEIKYANTPELHWDSPYKSGGALPADDLRDAGVNMQQLKIAQGQVGNARVRSTSATPISAASTSAIVSYMAPDADACEVRVSATQWGLGTPVSDGGGARSRNVTITLTAGTLDYIALLCPVQSFVCRELGGHCTLVPHQ